jgi:hypothetical protein
MDLPHALLRKASESKSLRCLIFKFHTPIQQRQNKDACTDDYPIFPRHFSIKSSCSHHPRGYGDFYASPLGTSNPFYHCIAVIAACTVPRNREQTTQSNTGQPNTTQHNVVSLLMMLLVRKREFLLAKKFPHSFLVRHYRLQLQHGEQ